MCGRFTLTADPNELRQTFPWLNIPDDLSPRYNIAPSQPVAVVANDGQQRLDYYVWGLIPSWAKDPTIGNRMINARAETLLEKPTFRAPFRHKRCLILADGFYEWKQNPSRKGKIPMYIKLKSGKPFAFAGLWDRWLSPDGSEVLSCAIITITPNQMMQEIHNRMPVILPDEAHPLWLESGDREITRLQAALKPYPGEEMIAYLVSPLVNNPANDNPACIQSWQ